MSEFFPDVMVDIETTGVQPDLTSMIQLSAVKFNLKQRKIDTSAPFDQCMFPLPRRFWDEGTRNWWMKEDHYPVLTEKIMPKMRDPRTVLQEFTAWMGGAPAHGVRMWSRGRFDDQFISSHLRDCDMQQIFDYRAVTDLRSFEFALFYPGAIPSEGDLGLGEFQGARHDGIADCFHQLRRLFAMVDRAAQGVVVG